MTRSIITSLTLKEISAVDRPAQTGAKMTIMKRADDHAAQIAKALVDGKATSFAAVYREQMSDRELWPMVDALQQSIRSILTDDDLPDADRHTKAEASVAQFLAAVRAKLPASEDEVAKAILKAAGSTGARQTANEGDHSMADAPTVESLQAEIETLTKRAETAETIAKMSDAEKAHLAKLSAEDKKAFLAMSDVERAKLVKKSADADETVVVEGQTIAKSAVGDATFAVMKAQAARIAEIEKRAEGDRDAAELVRLEKRATDELANLPGETVAKAKVLKAVNAMGEAERATLDGMLRAGNSALAKAFSAVGTRTAAEVDVTKRRDETVSKIANDEKVSKSRATEIAAQRHPELFTASAA